MGVPMTLLDGATGTELKRRGVRVPDHITSVWSALALLEAPEAIVAVHRDYLEAGADVITANNYAVTRPLLARENMDGQFRELTATSVELARRARDEVGRPARIAGSLPPLETSYRPERVGADDAIARDYREMAEALAPRVDLLLCETLSCAREGRAAAEAACATGLPVWLSWTLQGNRPDRLPSGETLQQAYGAVSDLPIEAFLVNCCGANFVSRAIPILRRLTDVRVGGYANATDVVEARDESDRPAPEDVTRIQLDVEEYVDACARWIDQGATILGGCCFTRPQHIAALRKRLDATAPPSASRSE